MSPQLVGLSRTLVGRTLCGFLVLLAAATVAQAQEMPPPASIAFVEGTVTLEREGEVRPAVLNMPLVPGDRVRTGAGRVEIRFPDGTGIELLEDTWVELLTPTRVRVLAGTIDRLEPLRPNAASTSYLPPDLQMYGATFDRYGSWRYAPSYGYVWYPMVAPEWRPYYYGYWEPVPSYGWTWIGTDGWAWPTHHFGRWGFARNAWFWIPDRTFSAAWVSWGTAPGYVSWCPLGFDNRPVFALSVGYGHSWSGWTVLPRTHFGGRGYYANHYAVEPRGLPQNLTFVSQSTPPVAVPRYVNNGAGAATGVAVPRAGAVGRYSRPSTVNNQQSIVPRPPSPTDLPERRDQWPASNGRRAGAYVQPQAPNGFQVPAPSTPSPATGYRAQPRWTLPGAPAPQPMPAPSLAVPRAATQPPPPSAGMPRVNAEPRPMPSVMPPFSTPGAPRVNMAPPPVPAPAPMAVPRAGTAPAARPAPAPPPQAAPQHSAPSGGGHERAGSGAQPRGGGGEGQRAGGARQRG